MAVAGGIFRVTKHQKVGASLYCVVWWIHREGQNPISEELCHESLRDNDLSDIIRAVKPDTSFSDSHARFMTTRWSIVLSCSESATDEQKAQAALAELCKI